MLDASPTPTPIHRLRDADVFGAFTQAEIAALITYLFGILPQRGCEQRCAGCHASALPTVNAASWEMTSHVIAALAAWAARLKLVPQSGIPGALIETFRDSDPAHLRFTSADGITRGIGDYARLIMHTLHRPVKVMTSGARARVIDGEFQINADDLTQVELAAQFSGRLSVSASIETTQYRQLGEKRDAIVLARTLEAFLRGILEQRNPCELFVDVMFFSAHGDDPLTRRTLDLYRAVIDAIDPAYLAPSIKSQLIRVFAQSIDGTRNRQFTPSHSPLGVRVSPHLNIGRAAITERGQHLNSAHPSDWLSILPGDPDDELSLDGEHYRRADLAQNYAIRHQAIEHLRGRGMGGFLAENIHMSGNPLAFFRAEIDLTGASVHRLAGRFAAPGMTLPPGVNLLVSDPIGDELQVVIPYKPLG